MNDSSMPGGTGPKPEASDARVPDFGQRINPRSAGDALRPERVPGPPVRSQQAKHPIILVTNFAMTILVVGYESSMADALFTGVGEVFGDAMPDVATTLHGVQSLFEPEFLVEIEAVAEL